MARFRKDDRVGVKPKLGAAQNAKDRVGTVMKISHNGTYTLYDVAIDGPEPREVVTDRHDRFYRVHVPAPIKRTSAAFPA